MLDPTHTVNHTFAVAVRRVDHDRVDTRLNQSLHTGLGTFTDAHCRTNPQAAGHITSGIGEIELLGDVFHGDQAFELKGLVDHQQTFQLVLV